MDLDKLKLASALLQTLYDSTEAPGYLNKEDNLRVIRHIQELIDEIISSQNPMDEKES